MISGSEIGRSGPEELASAGRPVARRVSAATMAESNSAAVIWPGYFASIRSRMAAKRLRLSAADSRPILLAGNASLIVC